MRYRTCKAGSKCRGKNRQRKIRKVTTVWHEKFGDEFEPKPEVEEWSVDVSLGERSKRLCCSRSDGKNHLNNLLNKNNKL